MVEYRGASRSAMGDGDEEGRVPNEKDFEPVFLRNVQDQINSTLELADPNF